MKNIHLKADLCVKNHMCPIINICPVNAISQESKISAPIIDKDKCINCGKCVKYCPYGAFSLKS